MDLSGRGASDGEYITYTRQRAPRRRGDARVGARRNRPIESGTGRRLRNVERRRFASIFAAASDDPALPALVARCALYGDLWDAPQASMLSARAAGHPLAASVSVCLRGPCGCVTGIDLAARAARPTSIDRMSTHRCCSSTAMRTAKCLLSHSRNACINDARDGWSSERAVGFARRRARLRQLSARRYFLEPCAGLFRPRRSADRRPSGTCPRELLYGSQRIYSLPTAV